LNITDEIFAVFHKRGDGAYFGESVSMTEHALQAAHFARAAGAPPGLILAALLHDVGHLVADVPDDLADWTTDAHHEEIGGRWLAQRFRPEVWEPDMKWPHSKRNRTTGTRCWSGNPTTRARWRD
jgi:predicted HD phosphohydrolase